MLKKTLLWVWAVLALGWSAMCIFAYFLGAGMSAGSSSGAGLGFLLYWFVPIVVPVVIYKGFNRKKS